MNSDSNSPPKTIRERTGRLFKMAGSMASHEIIKRIQSKSMGTDPLLNLSQARLLVKELGHLKGAAMKLGQMLALEARDYFPEEICVVLDQLQSNASFLDFSTIESILQAELGSRYKDFEQLSRNPIAAASIGQVHFAKLKSGQEIAIKVQYPGIQDSIDSDVKVLSTLLKTISVMMRKHVDLTELVQEFSEIFIQESDYLQEATFTEAYRKRASIAPELIVPAVFHEYSSKKVLTLEFKRGQKFTDWVNSPEATAEMKTFYGKTILDLYTREFCEWGLVQTDPNLGNFLFCSKEQKLVLLDFGATKAYDLNFRIKYSQLIAASFSKDFRKIVRIGEEMRLIDPRESSETQTIFSELMIESTRPIISKEYDFSDNTYPEIMRSLTRKLVASLRFSPPPKDLIFLHRKLSGIFYILRALKVKLPLTPYAERLETLAHSVSAPAL